MRRPYHRQKHRRGQIMVLFALVLPVVVAFLALSVAGSLSLNTKSQIDQATLTAAIAASGDACMSSPYGYDAYQCQSPRAQAQYAAEGLTSGSTSAPLPVPPFTMPDAASPAFGSPATTRCPVPPAPTPVDCVVREQKLAQWSAEDEAFPVLQADYANKTIKRCTPPLVEADCRAMLTSADQVVYQAQVSYWYYYDTDDRCTALVSCDASGMPVPFPTEITDRPSEDSQAMNGADGGAVYPDTDTPTSPLACPAAKAPGQFSRAVVITAWIQLHSPLSGLIGVSSSIFKATSLSFGCAS